MNCNICENDNLIKILDLPKFPFTGIFVSKPINNVVEDQGLLYCESCGHAQLEKYILPEIIYDNTYSHRSSKSNMATSGNDFFCDFLKKIVDKRKFKTVLDVGCNDLYLLNQASSFAENLFGIDPIWKEKNRFIENNIHVIGDFIENVDLSKDVNNKLDLIFSTHTLEHVHNPKKELEKIANYAEDDALFVIEVPSFDTLVHNHRFDQVFHQHIQYFSLASIQKLIDIIGCEYIDHTFNYSFWGGTLLVAFKKIKVKEKKPSKKKFYPISKDIIKKSYNIFKLQLQSFIKSIEINKNKKLYGYGAAQMVPTLAYHMQSDLSFLECIYDDNRDKHNLKYPNLKPIIQHITDNNFYKNQDIIILAIDSLRPIFQRLIGLQPSRIYLPLNIA